LYGALPVACSALEQRLSRKLTIPKAPRKLLQVKLVAAPLVGEGDAAMQMARCNVSKDAFYSGAVRLRDHS